MDLLALAQQHWSFVAFALICNAVVKGLKAVIPRNSTEKWKRLVVRTLPLHPVTFGVLFGLIPGMPAPESITTTGARVVYFALAGVCSTWVYQLVKQWVKSKDAPQKTHTPQSET